MFLVGQGDGSVVPLFLSLPYSLLAGKQKTRGLLFSVSPMI